MNPAASEVCNGGDDDCDGLVDDDDAPADPSTWFADADADSFGDAATSAAACVAPAGYVADAKDCDDGDGAVNPAATEVCNGGDDDCDGLVDDDDTPADPSTWFADADADGFGDAATSASACVAPAGYVADATDCDDADASTLPGAADTCGDGVDSDCDGADGACRAGLYDENTADGYWTAESVDTSLGWGIGNAGDLDGDGVDDLVAGAETFKVGTRSNGSAWIVYGGAGVDNGGAGDLATEASLVGTSNSQFGSGVAPVGDIDEDGYDDVMIGGGKGAVLLYGSATRLAHGESVSSATVSVTTTSTLDTDGTYLGGHAADLDGDGHQDLVIGDWLHIAGTHTGAVLLDYGSGVRETSTVSLDSAPYLYETGSPLSLYNALDTGDLDGDGLSEILVGYFWRVAASNYDGRAWLVEGRSTDFAGANNIATVAVAKWSGGSGDRLGSGLAIVPDMDGDGRCELVIGASAADGAATDAGATYVYRGGTSFSSTMSTSTADLVLTGDTASESFGYRVVGLDDMDGDGFGDLAVSASGYTALASGEQGGVFVFGGGASMGGTLTVADADYGWIRDTDGGLYHRMATGDFDGDGLSDLATARIEVGGYSAGLDLFLGGPVR